MIRAARRRMLRGKHSQRATHFLMPIFSSCMEICHRLTAPPFLRPSSSLMRPPSVLQGVFSSVQTWLPEGWICRGWTGSCTTTPRRIRRATFTVSGAPPALATPETPCCFSCHMRRDTSLT
ncbi:uncharacterized protein Tco025E_00007 [Trypanosoma conorhini]|uniref:Uncharacterized protein n=1 Tax=Trypanosoma conorhini TaxID=83891 RepID=A0A3R7P213_9TRYP|nr:uncharacterized protein Tco025E_00007 [Trypanosoma conorhini]RNF27623.1 hypothetical protein Tco025E_00007 [Trypanosoma conorhini]